MRKVRKTRPQVRCCQGMTGKWRDLRVRILSAAALIAIAVLVGLAGWQPFGVMIACVTGVMIWELMRMLAPRSVVLAYGMGALAACLVLVSMVPIWPNGLLAILIGTGALGGLVGLVAGRDRMVGGLYAMAIAATGLELSQLFQLDPRAVIIVIALVALTDIAGYFAGKAIGGAKFWPSISPKKTWAGIVAGWMAAGALGLWLMAVRGAPGAVLIVAVGMSLASQMGDIVESAFKRRAGVKDSSGLIPGHGGFLDRFDGIVGATTVMFVGLTVVDL